MLRDDIKEYRPNLKPEAREPLIDLAGNLGFIVTRASRYEGEPSVRDLLHALADAYRLDSGAVIDALRGIGVVNKSAVISDAQPLDEDEQTGGAAE
jgi:hypothetical protein